MSNNKWTTHDIPNLTGKVIIVTGGNSGLGYESVKAFAEKGAEVVLASRSVENGVKAKAEIGNEIGNVSGKVVVMQLDLQEFASVKQFAANFTEKYDRLDVLLNNAGIMTTPYFKTKDGLEGQIGVNHFGHFLLTGELLPLLEKTEKSRVVNVSSIAHKQGKMHFDNLMFNGGKGYTPIKAYGQSKLANLLFTYELQRFFETKGLSAIAVAAHPGVSITNLVRHLEGKMTFKIFGFIFKLIAQDPAKGALPQIRASVDASVKGAEYYGPNGFTEMSGSPVLVKPMPHAQGHEDAKKLWDISEQITGVKFN